MESPLAELSRQLLDAGDGELLATPLDHLEQLEERAARDEADTLLRAFHESGEVSTLRDALSGDRLARWAHETCTSSEERALALQLRRWLGLESGAAGPDDPRRLVVLPALPHDPEALVRWARAYDVVGELMRPIEEVLAVEPLGGEHSLLEACCPEFVAGEGSPAARPQLARLRELEPRARNYLRAQAADAKALAAREKLWRQAWPAPAPAPTGPLRALAERLRALVPSSAPSSLHGLGFVPGRPVALDHATGVCRGFLPDPTGNFAVRLWLSGYEQRAIEGQCERCASGRCIHVAALAARLIDACLYAEDSLRRSVVELVRIPSWQRFVEALAATPTKQRSAQQLSFVVRESDGRYSVGVFRQGKAGATAARLMSPLKLLRAGELDDRDRAVLEALATRTRTLGPQFVRADREVLRSLVAHPHVLREEDGAALDVREEPLDVQLIERADGLSPQVSLAGSPVLAGTRDNFVVSADRARKRLVVAAVPPGVQRLLGALENFRGVLPKESYPALAARFGELSSIARVSIPDALVGYEHAPPKKLLLRISPQLDEGVEIALAVRVFPLSPLWTPGEGAERVEGLVDGAARFTRRDLRAEREHAAAAITALGLGEHAEIARCSYRVDSYAAALEVLSRAAHLHELLDIEWAEVGRSPRITQTVKQSDLHIRLWKRGRWMMLEGAAAAHNGEAEIAIGRLLEAVRRGERFVQIEGNDYAEIERALFERLQDAQLGISRQDRQLALALAAAPSFMENLGDRVNGADVESRSWLEHLKHRHEPLDAALALPLHDQLRSYQRDGVRFLLQLARWSSGACLADDMGLGKTVQAISLLLQRGELGPALVIAPTSLLGNWASELARFAPELRAFVYRGPDREAQLSELGPRSVLVMSYEISLRDSERLKNCLFATQIIDEAQIIRNARTRRAQAIAEIPAEFRVALTGTPIENRLGDLWSLFALIAPGLLGSWSRFRALFAVPIERYEDAERIARLRRLVEPFMLRRTKDQVAPELPARTEVIHGVELSEPEQQLYRAALLHARQALGKHKKHERKATVYILAELTKLRQLACHPRLVLADSRVESSKLHALLRLLEDILPRGHRALVFSQFTTHLTLVHEALQARDVSTLYLDGSTPSGDRAKLVEQFQAGAAAVFLISLKAGGTGLNLTAADYVVHLDPWWNPAAEDQASDRAHRIGQDKPVTIIKLVSQGTIEERVLHLHEHKRRLAAGILAGEADEQSGGELDEEALASLLAD